MSRRWRRGARVPKPRAHRGTRALADSPQPTSTTRRSAGSGPRDRSTVRVKAHRARRRKRVAFIETIGRSRVGRTTAIHAGPLHLADRGFCASNRATCGTHDTTEQCRSFEKNARPIRASKPDRQPPVSHASGSQDSSWEATEARSKIIEEQFQLCRRVFAVFDLICCCITICQRPCDYCIDGLAWELGV